MNYLCFLLLCSFMAGCAVSSVNDNNLTDPSTPSTSESIPAGDNSRNALDWPGTYTDVIPCSDCTGRYISVELRSDQTYYQLTKHLGRSGKSVTETGRFEWDASGSFITLTSGQKYKVGENVLIIPGRNEQDEGVRIEKMGQRVTDRYWNLVRAGGQQISTVDDQQAPYLLLLEESGRVFGFNGCNSFNGSFTLDGLRMGFSQMATTMRACPDIPYEREYMQALYTADNYTLNQQGDTLSLNKGRMAPLAVFAASNPE